MLLRWHVVMCVCVCVSVCVSVCACVQRSVPLAGPGPAGWQGPEAPTAEGAPRASGGQAVARLRAVGRCPTRRAARSRGTSCFWRSRGWQCRRRGADRCRQRRCTTSDRSICRGRRGHANATPPSCDPLSRRSASSASRSGTRTGRSMWLDSDEVSRKAYADPFRAESHHCVVTVDVVHHDDSWYMCAYRHHHKCVRVGRDVLSAHCAVFLRVNPAPWAVLPSDQDWEQFQLCV